MRVRKKCICVCGRRGGGDELAWRYASAKMQVTSKHHCTYMTMRVSIHFLSVVEHVFVLLARYTKANLAAEKFPLHNGAFDMLLLDVQFASALKGTAQAIDFSFVTGGTPVQAGQR